MTEKGEEQPDRFEDSQSDRYSTQTILLVEPTRLIGQVVSLVCKQRGLHVRACTEAGAALSAIAEQKPTAVLTSFELPGLSGASLIAALKACPSHRGIPTGLMTSTESLDRFLNFYKPDAILYKKHDFKDALDGFLEQYGIGSKGQTDRADRAKPVEKLNGRILLAEDTRIIQKLIGTLLHVAGAEVVIVENGAEAVSAASEEQYDLILMDIEMPNMDGREAAKQIRAEGINVPMIASTAHDCDSFREEALELGFDDVLTKPVDRQVLIDTCAKRIGSGLT